MEFSWLLFYFSKVYGISWPIFTFSTLLSSINFLMLYSACFSKTFEVTCMKLHTEDHITHGLSARKEKEAVSL